MDVVKLFLNVVNKEYYMERRITRSLSEGRNSSVANRRDTNDTVFFSIQRDSGLCAPIRPTDLFAIVAQQ